MITLKTTIMKRIFTITAALAILLTGCNNDPVAYFEYSPQNPIAGEQVFFTNLSSDAETFEWSFIGPTGTTVSSVYNQVHTFTSGGTHTVQLQAYGRRGAMDVATATINVISIQPQAGFNVYTDVPTADGPVAFETDIVFYGEQVEFDNTSLDGVSYLWDFGDGYTSEATSPIYSYDTPGVYDVTLTAYGPGGEEDEVTKTIEVADFINSVLRITVLEYIDEYAVPGTSVLLYETLDDWDNQTNPSEDVLTSPLGKCVFQALENQRYYVDAWEEDHDNWTLGAEDAGFIETQILEPGYIHDFIAYVDYYAPEKKMTVKRIGRKQVDRTRVTDKKASEMRTLKANKFSKSR